MTMILPMKEFEIVDENDKELLLIEKQIEGVPTLWLHWLEDEPIEIRLVRSVCSHCGGTGRIVNPAIEGNGFTSSEWHEACSNDDEFERNYWNGNYDISCPKCKRGRCAKIADRDPYKDMIEQNIREYEDQRDWEENARARGIQF
tara:strand:- start:156 stop:590 length:435 start_codon:yes stop_codon:yes gene_type:complete